VPVELDGRRGEEERAAEILRIDAGFGDCLMRSCFGQFVGEGACALAARRQEIDHARDAGVQLVDGKAGDRMDAGLSGGQCCPVIGLADAQRRDHADSGDRDDRPAQMILQLCHGSILDHCCLVAAI
jgi:hypothetical protein